MLNPLLKEFPVRDGEFKYVVGSEVFSEDKIDEICGFFKGEAPWHRGEGSFYNQDEFNFSSSDIPPHLNWLTSPPIIAELRLIMENWFKVRLDKNCDVSARRIGVGQGVGPHTDNPFYGYETHRLVIGASKNYNDDQCGHLLLLHDRSGESIFAALRPIANSFFAFAAQQRSFHAVTDVKYGTVEFLVFSFTHIGNCGTVTSYVDGMLESNKSIVFTSEALNVVSWMKSLGVNKIKHTNSTLLEHLIGVYRMLSSWNLRSHISSAGLCHSLYSFGEDVILKESQRELLRQQIGDFSEECVWRFCNEDRMAAILSCEDGEVATCLVHLLLANTIEQMPRIHFSEANWNLDREFFSRMTPLLCEKAKAVARHIYFLP
jgi:hypothetical protein